MAIEVSHCGSGCTLGGAHLPAGVHRGDHLVEQDAGPADLLGGVHQPVELLPAGAPGARLLIRHRQRRDADPRGGHQALALGPGLDPRELAALRTIQNLARRCRKARTA